MFTVLSLALFYVFFSLERNVILRILEASVRLNMCEVKEINIPLIKVLAREQTENITKIVHIPNVTFVMLYSVYLICLTDKELSLKIDLKTDNHPGSSRESLIFVNSFCLLNALPLSLPLFYSPLGISLFSRIKSRSC